VRLGVAEPQIWTVDLNNINLLTQLSTGTNPQISPNGRRVAYVQQDAQTKRRAVWIMNIDGTGKKRLSPEVLSHDEMDPRWSPDGNWIAFTSNNPADAKNKTDSDIWLMTAEGKKRTQLTKNQSHDDAPCWNRDGTWIYFRSNRGGAWNVWRLAPVFP
jgi:Tol biopolymer transport system component